MRVLFATLLSAGLLAAQGVDRTRPPVSPPAKSYKLPPVTETKLPNGLTVVLAEDGRVPLVTLRLAILAGNKRDPKEIPGLAAAVAAMLPQGTKTRNYQQIAEELDSIGAIMSANAAADAISVEGSVLAEHASDLLALFADIARNATIPENELSLYRQNRKQTLAVARSQPAYLANEEFRKRLFGDQPYGHIGPTAESIDKMDQKALTDFRDTYVVPNNSYLIIVGKLGSRAALTKTIADQFGPWVQKPVPAYTAPQPPAPKRQLVLVDRPGSVQADIRMGKIGSTYNDADYFPETMGSLIEGGAFNSRLFRDIREKLGYAYDVHTEVGGLTDSGTFSTVTQVRNEVVPDALQKVMEHLDLMAKEPVASKELSDAKSYANGVFLLSMEPQRGLADRLVQMKVMNEPKNYLEMYTTRVNSVEPAQIEAAAKKVMATGDATVVVVGDAAKIEEPLGKIGKFEVVKPPQ